MSNNSDLKILISGALNVGKTIGDINVQLRGIEKRINKLKLRVDIDDKIINTLSKFSEQMKRIQGDALQAGKRVEEVMLPSGTKVKTTSFDNLHKSLEDLVIQAERNEKSAKSLANQTDTMGDVAKNSKKHIDSLNETLGENSKITKQTITENAKGERTYQNVQKNLENNTTLTTKYNEATQELTKTLKIDHEQEQKRLDGLKKIATERSKLRRELTGMRQDGTISDTQFTDLSKRLANVNDDQSLKRYRESMSNLVAETNRATTSQSKLNQAQGKFKLHLQDLYSQGKITEKQLKQFGNAVDTRQSVGQLKTLERQIDKIATKTSKVSNTGILGSHDTEMSLRKFDNRVAEALRQYPSINKQEIEKLQRDLHGLAGTTGLTRQQLQLYNQSLTETITRTKQVTANTNTLAGAFQNAMIKFP